MTRRQRSRDGVPCGTGRSSEGGSRRPERLHDAARAAASPHSLRDGRALHPPDEAAHSGLTCPEIFLKYCPSTQPSPDIDAHSPQAATQPRPAYLGQVPRAGAEHGHHEGLEEGGEAWLPPGVPRVESAHVHHRVLHDDEGLEPVARVVDPVETVVVRFGLGRREERGVLCGGPLARASAGALHGAALGLGERRGWHFVFEEARGLVICRSSDHLRWVVLRRRGRKRYWLFALRCWLAA